MVLLVMPLGRLTSSVSSDLIERWFQTHSIVPGWVSNLLFALSGRLAIPAIDLLAFLSGFVLIGTELLVLRIHPRGRQILKRVKQDVKECIELISLRRYFTRLRGS